MVTLMGILNVTPDSFWRSSRVSASSVRRRMEEMVADGAGIIDIGAVSTRPGASPVSEEEEWSRLEPVLSQLDSRVRISIDTTRSSIIYKAYGLLCAGLGENYARTLMINDISAGEEDTGMLPCASSLGLTYIAMHKRGDPCTMDGLTRYEPDLLTAVKEYFVQFGARADKAGVKDWILDPGFGFAKTEEQNLTILDNLGELKLLGRPLLAGISNKRFTRGRTQELQLRAALGGADILRVHDVAACRRSLEAQGLI